ncbi:hypothetical protein NC651_025713 [Populus alba x Populus x berolinensis]|nr:hypothetical protein NC651_025713 [Populus alba x Populus x berolinensis]
MGSRHISGEQKANLSNPPSRPSLTRSFSTRQGQAEDCKHLIWVCTLYSIFALYLNKTFLLPSQGDFFSSFAVTFTRDLLTRRTFLR